MPRQERAVRTLNSVLDAAAAEFDEFGYAGARMERIVERTGLTKGAVYFHFKSKRALADALVEGKLNQWAPVIAGVTQSGTRGADAALQMSVLVARAFRDDVRVRAGLRLSREMPTDSATDPYEMWSGVIFTFLNQGVEDGTLRRDLDMRKAARVAVRAFFGTYMVASELGHVEAVDEEVREMWHVLVSGLAATNGKPTAAE